MKPIVGSGTHRFRMTTAALVLGALVASAGLAIAQPPSGEPAPAASSEREQRIREALRRSLDDAKRFQEQLEAAVKAIESGERPAAVVERMDPLTRRFMMADNLRRLGGDDGEQRMPGDRLRERRDGQREGGPREGPDRGPERGPERNLDRGPADGPPGPRGPLQMSPAEAERTLENLRKELPDVANALDELRKESPRMAEGMTRRLAPRFRDAMELREREPELFRLRVEEIRSGMGVLRAIRSYRVAQELPETDAAKTQRVTDATTQVRSAVAAALDQRLAIQEYETKRLERRLEQLKRELAERRERKDEAVSKMVERVQEGEMPGGLFGDSGPKGPDGPRPDREPR